MIQIILSLLLGFSFANAESSSVFNENTPLPTILQEKILKALLEDFSCADVSGISEVSTISEEIAVDQVIVDYKYTTELTVFVKLDPYRTMPVKVVVESFQASIQNPDIDYTSIKSIRPNGKEMFCD